MDSYGPRSGHLIPRLAVAGRSPVAAHVRTVGEGSGLFYLAADLGRRGSRRCVSSGPAVPVRFHNSVNERHNPID